MKESHIERSLVQAVGRMGGLALKLNATGLDGVPDRLVLLPDGKTAFVELKAPGKQLRPLQVKRKSQLETLGFSVYVIDSMDQIAKTLGEVIDGGEAQ